MKEDDEQRKLAAIFRAAGARDPEGWARSQVHEGIPQLHRFLFLRQAWQRLVSDRATGWIDRLIAQAQRSPEAPFAGAGHVLASLRSKGASDQELTELVRCTQAELLVGFAYLLEDPSIDDPALSDIGWGLFALNEQGDPTAPITGLHESVLDTDPEGREMRPARDR